ncbi:hypothetical protein PCANC_22782 [Puccinia coronata f. sp. avenae]|nr:hypothetical protein PCASD_19966 [Puccinia coronata f. sp. avenae]PLW32447.1 hypothetical protein PCANC_22782 [Puccinia coronata f. sp. avenae]
MVKELSNLIEQHDGTRWDPLVNHLCCFCHVVALVCGAGLAAIKLSTAEGPKSRKPESFQVLETITKEGDIIKDGLEVSGDKDEIGTEDEFNDNEEEDRSEAKLSNKNKGKYASSGIGLTLKKIDYVCCQIASSPAKQAEFQVWADKLGYEGPGVVNQLLFNKTKNGKRKYFNGYKFGSKEWDNIKVLNTVLKEFLDLTKRMEGNGPTSSMVLYEYSRLIKFLEELKQRWADTLLYITAG